MKERIHINVTAEQKAKFQDLANQAEITITDLIISKVLNLPVVENTGSSKYYIPKRKKTVGRRIKKMEKNYYEITVAENNEERKELVGIGWSLPSEGIRNCDPIEEWGMNEEVIQWIKKEIEDGELETIFSFGAGEWIRINMEDMKNILQELGLM